MAEIEICLRTVFRHITFAMLIRVHCPRVYIDVRVKLLNGYIIAPSLQEFA